MLIIFVYINTYNGNLGKTAHYNKILIRLKLLYENKATPFQFTTEL